MLRRSSTLISFLPSRIPMNLFVLETLTLTTPVHHYSSSLCLKVRHLDELEGSQGCVNYEAPSVFDGKK